MEPLPAAATERLEALSPVYREVLERTDRGDSAEEIAAGLGIEVESVEPLRQIAGAKSRRLAVSADRKEPA